MRSSSPARRLTGALILACLVLSACSEAEPEPTACPVPSFPPVTTPVEGATPLPPAEDSSNSLCSAESLSSVEAFTLLQDAAAAIVIIDTRTPAEYAGGHIPGAVNLSTQDAAFWDQVGELPLAGTYLLYCRTGRTTRRVVEGMRAMGFTDVCHIGDGFNGWKRADLPVEEGSS